MTAATTRNLSCSTRHHPRSLITSSSPATHMPRPQHRLTSNTSAPLSSPTNMANYHVFSMRRYCDSGAIRARFRGRHLCVLHYFGNYGVPVMEQKGRHFSTFLHLSDSTTAERTSEDQSVPQHLPDASSNYPQEESNLDNVLLTDGTQWDTASPFETIKSLAQLYKTSRNSFQLKQFIREQTRIILRMRKHVKSKEQLKLTRKRLPKSLQVRLVRYLMRHKKHPSQTEIFFFAEKYNVDPDAILSYLNSNCDLEQLSHEKLPAEMRECIHAFMLKFENRILTRQKFSQLRQSLSNTLQKSVNPIHLMIELSKMLNPSAEEKEKMDQYMREHLFIPPTEREEAQLSTKWNISKWKLNKYFLNQFLKCKLPLEQHQVQQIDEWLRKNDYRVPSVREMEQFSTAWQIPYNQLCYHLLNRRRGHVSYDKEEVIRMLREHSQHLRQKFTSSYRRKGIGMHTGCSPTMLSNLMYSIRNPEGEVTDENRAFLKEWIVSHSFPPTSEEYTHLQRKTGLNRYQIGSLLLSSLHQTVTSDQMKIIEREWKKDSTLTPERKKSIAAETGLYPTQIRYKFRILNERLDRSTMDEELRQKMVNWLEECDYNPKEDAITKWSSEHGIHRSVLVHKIYLHRLREQAASKSIPKEELQRIQDYVATHGRSRDSLRHLSEETGLTITLLSFITRQLQEEFIKGMKETISQWITNHKGLRVSDEQISEWIRNTPGYEKEIRRLTSNTKLTDEEREALNNLQDRYQGFIPTSELEQLSQDLVIPFDRIVAYYRRSEKYFRELKKDSWEESVITWLHELDCQPTGAERRAKSEEIGVPTSKIAHLQACLKRYARRKITPQDRARVEELVQKHMDVPPEHEQEQLRQELGLEVAQLAAMVGHTLRRLKKSETQK